MLFRAFFPCCRERSLRSYRPEIITALATDTDRVRRPRPEPALSLWCENRQPFTLVQYSFKILGDIWAPDFIWNPIVLLGLA